MREEHRPLRVALRGAQQRVQGLARGPSGRVEPLGDVRGDVGVGQAAEAHRHGRAVQRPVLRLEQQPHQPRLGAGEDVGRDLAVVLDVAAQKTVQAVDPPDVLELVECDERAVAARGLEPERQLEQRVQRGEHVPGRLELEPRADAERAERQADARPLQECLDASPDLALQLLRVRTLEPHRDVRDRRHPIEVDEDRDQPLVPLTVVEGELEQARLPVLAGCVEPDVVAPDDVPQERAHLLLTVDDVLRRDRVRVDERVDVFDHAPNRLPGRCHADYWSVVCQAQARSGLAGDVPADLDLVRVRRHPRDALPLLALQPHEIEVAAPSPSAPARSRWR